MHPSCLSALSRARSHSRRLFARLLLVSLLTALGGPPGRADMGMPPDCPMVDAYKPQDLTGLDLNQLLDLDVLPVDVTGTHTHLSHEIMLGVRFMSDHMVGNRDGTHDLTVNDVLKRYPVAHTQMTMGMTMFDLMYAPSDSATLMAMLPYKDMNMDHVNREGVHYATYSSGFGDVSLMGNYTVLGNIRKGGNRLLLNAGLSFPTGSINKTYDTPSRRNAPLEYPMQLGSGTYDLMPGITYLGNTRDWAYGAQLMATNRLGRNSAGYRLGDEYHLNTWGYYRINDWVGPSLRLEYSDVGKISGSDSRMNPATNSAFDPNQQGGKRLDLVVGVDVYAPKGRFKGNRLTLEYGRPVYQDLNGLQLNTQYEYTVGWSYTYRP